ncbi:SsrA-binding protein SmpB [Buchnera aphidicola (Hormaphis cornu)]|nr:SsrA-binding protein SmpB [Buchnera aphidicola (Hormaphis cornu)]
MQELIYNKKIHYFFEIKKNFEAGIALQGWEIKSIRKKKLNIENSYVHFRSGNAYLVGVNIEPLFNTVDDALNLKNRDRKLLLHKQEINFLSEKVKIERYTVVLISIFLKKNFLCKLRLGLAQGKNKKDKRDQEKKDSWKKEQNIVFKRIKLLR